MVVTGDCRLLHTCEMCEFNNETDCKADKNEHNRWLVNKRMNEIKHKLIVGSNKGGVGKSTVTTNLAIALKKAVIRWVWQMPICTVPIFQNSCRQKTFV